MKKIFLIHFFIILILNSCDSSLKQHKDIIESMAGKELIFPDEMKCQIQDTIFDYNLDDADYKIVTYIDSTGCTSCQMKLASWNEIIDEFKTLDNIDVDFLMIISSKESKDISHILKTGNFHHHVFIDRDGVFDELNEIPDETVYRTFLLDADNKIIAVGNPALNPKIKDLYKSILNREVERNEYTESSLVRNPVRNIGLRTAGDTVKVSFPMLNRDTITYHVQEIIPSCDCMIVETEKEMISPGDKTNIKVEFETDSARSIFRKYVDIFYEEKEKPERLIIYGYLK